jgi:hypothetical protein
MKQLLADLLMTVRLYGTVRDIFFSLTVL